MRKSSKRPDLTVINYADSAFSKAQSLNSLSAKMCGKAGKVIEYSPSCIDVQFREKYSDILSIPTGGGCWLWKPYIVNDALQKINEGDYIFYLDSGALFRKKIEPFISFMEENGLDLLCFSTPFPENRWTKKSFIDHYYSVNNLKTDDFQIEATYFIIKKTKRTVSFCKEWLELCCVKENIDNSGLAEGEYHRNDQSLFSYLCKKNGFVSYASPSNRYFQDSFDHELVKFFKNDDERNVYRENYGEIPTIRDTEFSVFCHGIRNTYLYYIKVLYQYIHAIRQYYKSKHK